jgi:hypothetical protein
MLSPFHAPENRSVDSLFSSSDNVSTTFEKDSPPLFSFLSVLYAFSDRDITLVIKLINMYMCTYMHSAATKSYFPRCSCLDLASIANIAPSVRKFPSVSRSIQFVYFLDWCCAVQTIIIDSKVSTHKESVKNSSELLIHQVR